MFDLNTIMGVEMFTFLVGPNKIPIKVHANLFEGLSDPLHVLMNGKMSEAQNKICELPSLEPELFLGLVQFAYQEDYLNALTAYPHTKNSLVNKFQQYFTNEEFSEQFGHVDLLEIPLWPRFEELGQSLPALPNMWRVKRESHCWPPDSYLFLAKLASLANCYLIASLEDQVLKLLHRRLFLAILHGGRAFSRFLLLKYVAEFEVSPRLREMVLLYFALSGHIWRNCTAYLSLLKEKPDLALELWLLSTDTGSESATKRKREESEVDGPNKIAKP